MSTRTQPVPRAPERLLAGSPAARRLVHEAAARAASTRRVDVIGPGGHGKTVLLDALAAAFGAAGLTVHRDVADVGELGDDDALLIDDAHLLPSDVLERVAELAAAPGGHLVVAHRPWPRPPGTAALGSALAATRPPVVLEALDRTGVAARAALLLGGDDPPAELVDHVFEQTAGLPGLVDRLLAALAERAGPGCARGVPLPTDPPAGLLVQLGYLVQRLGDGVGGLLLARALGAPLESEVLVPLLGLPPDVGAAQLDELLEAARAAGMLTRDGRAVPLVSAAVLERTPQASRVELRRTLAEIELERGGNVLAAARGLLGTGASGSTVAEVFTTAAEEALRTGAPVAGELFDAAVRAGGPALDLAAGRAEAAVLTGDLDLALTQADQVLSEPDRVPPAEAVRAGTVAAAVLAHRGLLGRSADVYRWMNTALEPAMGTTAVLAVPALIGTGALDEAGKMLQAPSAASGVRPPTLLAGAEELMAQGVYDSVAGSPTAALSQLTRAASLLEASQRAALLPDTPAALAALVAVHCGELDVAQSVLERALRVGLGGRGAVTRHRLLLGWIALFRGATGAARSALSLASPPGAELEPRDELLAAALEVALARRAGDLAVLMTAWGRAREAIVRHPVDLFVLQQLGELWVAATRLRESSWIRPHLDEATDLLSRLGDPALWAAPLHWSGLQAAILSEDRESARRHAEALEAAADGSRYAAAMAAAAEHWVRLLDSEVDPAGVEAAARGLHAVGMAWEGGKLAGQAAIRTHDRKAMTALLGCARALQSTGPAARTVAVETDPEAEQRPKPAPKPEAEPAPDPTADGADGPLSDREREVAQLVLEGLTYRQIGERLFISAKTVEHHVARMRQRLGSGSRGELFAHLRQIVGPGTSEA
ncbi:MAG TPA: LuxR C-terminal-related transcriptional regulator [Pseudonocardia sp.]|uniref:LuxR C-terminal-related transcriptional regulator n=1 Tax=Pseudonocardia sp. TaxID=60912 RepID=UPI002B4B5F3E|nr:LuxR C-terminal-related transcriptional regulator [Pseudonocardia sp.]HLU58721.1 LuxR C-terminal-related transcriptional regulator [Pseudonocardia sp.]